MSPGTGSTHLARYKDFNTGKYDGVHLYGGSGVKDYTDSMKSIMMMALSDKHPNMMTMAEGSNNYDDDDHTWCEQAQYKWRQSQRRRPQRQPGSTVQYRYGTHYAQHVRNNQGAVLTNNRFSIFNQEN